MEFGEMKIHELDKDKNYIVEVKITKDVPFEELYAYLRTVKDTFSEVGINNCVFIPVGENMLINKDLSIKVDNRS